MTVEAGAKTLEQLFLSAAFAAPIGQRDYQWEHGECAALLADLCNCFENAGLLEPESTPDDDDEDKSGAPGSVFAAEGPQTPPIGMGNYYLGPMVLSPDPDYTGRLLIFDGLQRFTTRSLLLAALRDRLPVNPEAAWSPMQQLLGQRDALRLQLPTPGKAFERIAQGHRGGRSQSTAGARVVDQRLRQAYSQYAEEFASWTEQRVARFVALLRTRVWVVSVTIKDRQIADQAFVTANYRGRSLRSGDILKGRLVELAGDNVEAAGRIAEAFRVVQLQLDKRFDDFLAAVCFLKVRQYQAENLVNDVFAAIAPNGDVNVALAWAEKELPKLAAQYRQTIAFMQEKAVSGADLAFWRLSFLQRASRGSEAMDWTDWRPVAMALVEKHATDPKAKAEAILRLQKVCYAFWLIDLSPDRRARTWAEALNQLDHGVDPFKTIRRSGVPPIFGALTVKGPYRAKAKGRLTDSMSDDAYHGAIVRWLARRSASLWYC